MIRLDFLYLCWYTVFLLWTSFVLGQEALTVLNCPDDICMRPPEGGGNFVRVEIDEEPTLQNGTVLVQRNPVTFYEVGKPPTPVNYQFNGVTFCTFTIEVSFQCPALQNCPSDIEIIPNRYIDNKDGVFVHWTEPTQASGFTPATIVSSVDLPQAFVSYDETVNISYAFTDVEGREISCRFTVSVSDIDREPPQVYCPSDIIVNASSIWPCVPVSWEEPTSDDVEAQMTSRSSAPGDCFSIGVTGVTYDMTDRAGNVGSCQFDVMVEDTTPPEVVYCPPSPLPYILPPGQGTATISWPEPGAEDISGMVVITSDYQSGVSLGLGSTNVTYTFTDGAGNNARCEFELILTESLEVNPELLIATCPESITVTTAGSEETVSWDIPTTNQDDLVHEYASHTPGSLFPIGVARVTYIFNDRSTGNSATCSFLIAVIDAVPPVVESCPTPINVKPDRSGRSARHEWEEPTATDNSGLVRRVLRTSAPGDTFSANLDYDVPYTITYVFSDPSGNTATCEFVLTVLAPEQVDATLEIVNCPADITTATPENRKGALVSWTEPRTTDPIASWDRTHAPGFYFPIGTTTVEYMLTDGEQNKFTCTFDVIVEDTVPPRIFNCPLGFNVTTSSSSVAKFWSDPTATDNSGEDPTPTAPSNEPLPVGEVTHISYLFEDGSMNVAECAFQVNVRDSSDNTPPEIEDCPGDVEVDATTNSAVVTWTAPSTAEADVSVVSNHVPGDLFPIGVTMVTYILTDMEGNDAICSFAVTVSDHTAPSVACMNDVTFDTSSAGADAHVFWSEPFATDNSGTVYVARSHAPGDFFSPGTAMVSYTFTDPSDNAATCNFTVTVQVVPNTVAPGFISCPAELYYEADSITGVASFSWDEPLVEDDTDPAPVITGSHTSSDTFTIGRTAVIYEAIDSDGNMATPCVFYVTVDDVTPPTIEDCPSVINRRLDYGVTSIPVTWANPVAADNGALINRTASNIPGDIFFAGVSTVEYVFYDQSGNGASCIFQIIVEPVIDTEPPVIDNCPQAPVQVDAPPTDDKAVVTWAEVNATDALTRITVDSSHVSGSEFMIGQHGINIRFTDQPGNMADCNFTVVVSDVTPPLIESCPAEVLEIINTGALSAPVSWTMPTVTDNSGSYSDISNNAPAPGDMFQVGLTSVVYVYSDDSSNTASCEIQVTLIDDSRPPRIRHCPRIGVFKSVPENTTESIVRWRTPTAQDPDTNVTVTLTHQSGEVFTLGVQEVAYTFEDFSGNVAECTFNVTVTDEYLGSTTPQIPFMNCPQEVSVVSPSNSSCTAASWEEPSNNSDIIVLQNQTHRPGDTFCFENGPTEVVYTFYDFVYEKLFRCSFSVVVVDDTPPEIMDCPEDIKLSKNREDDNFQVSWTPPTAVDNSGEQDLLIRASHAPGSVFGAGETVVDYTFRDSSGNSESCQFTVTIDDGTIVFGLVIMEVVAISGGAVVAILVILLCLCCCCICCCCGGSDDARSDKALGADKRSDTESQLNEEMEDPHRYWVLPASVRRVQRRVSTRVNRSFRNVRERYSDRWDRGRPVSGDEREMSELNIRDSEEDSIPTLERKVIRIEDEDIYNL